MENQSNMMTLRKSCFDLTMFGQIKAT